MRINEVERVASIISREEAEEVARELIKSESYEPKRVEKKFGGPAIPPNILSAITYEGKLQDILQKRGRNLEKVEKVQINEAKQAFHRVSENLEKYAKEDRMLKDVEMALSYVEYCKKVKEVLSRGEKVGEDFLVLEGWATKPAIEKFRKLIGKGVFVFERKRDDRAPSHLKNEGVWKVFDPLMELFPGMKAGTLNITPLIGIGFLVMFGMMFPNIIDGLILGAASTYMWRKSKSKVYIFGMLLGISSILGGFVFEGCGLCGMQPLIPVFTDLQFFLLVVMAFAGVHQTLANILGATNNFLIGEHKEGAFRVANIFIYIAVVSYLLGSIPATIASSAVVAILIMYSGLRKTTEVPHVLSHFISYARIFAIAISHHTILEVSTSLLSNYLGGIPLLVGLLLLHLLVVFIEGIIAFVHTLRLSILEFGTKAIVPAQSKFTPVKVNKEIIEL